MKPNKKFGIVGLIGLLIAGVTTFLMQPSILSSVEKGGQIALAETFISAFNILMLSVLTLNYAKMYKELKTDITRKLIIVSSALMLYAASSSPITHSILGIEMVSIGPLTYIPEIFVTIASVTLLYENYQ